ncbi:MAG: 4-hydroxy-3-methylbut-2-enyl diphosphate reductase [Succinivibrionaceae bacterium]
MEKSIILVNPRGFCAGVSRAIEIVERVLKKFSDKKVYVLHEVVHNKHVVEDLRSKGAIFVESLDEIPNNSIVVFSAHGVSISIEQKAIEKQLIIFDATCPIVEKVHRKVRRLSSLNEEVIMIGHAGHQEVEGTLGQYTSKDGGMYIVTSEKDIDDLNVKNSNKLHFVTQTTLSVDETQLTIKKLQEKFENIIGPNVNDICYATQNRQMAVKNVVKDTDLILVVGSKNSSNSNRLSEVARSAGGKSLLIDDYHDLNEDELKGVNTIAITSGASAPEYLIKELIIFLKTKGFASVNDIGPNPEKQSFMMPKELL